MSEIAAACKASVSQALESITAIRKCALGQDNGGQEEPELLLKFNPYIVVLDRKVSWLEALLDAA
eukprot:9034323-Lingulodinium_polyedra.AAC.1